MEKIKKLYEEITSARAQKTINFVREHMKDVWKAVADMKKEGKYSYDIELEEDPDTEGLELLADAIRQEGFKSCLVHTIKVNDNDEVIVESFDMRISIAYVGRQNES